MSETLSEWVTSSIQECAKNRLVVTACLSGNDYAANIRGKSFGIVRPIVAAKDDAEKADLLLAQVRIVSESCG
ncbi:MAG TPA: hypothetical protein VF944_03205 [Candidatus Bathyarchaeia archaeon]